MLREVFKKLGFNETSQTLTQEQRDLRIYYESVKTTVAKANQELVEKQEDAGYIADWMGIRIKERVLRFASAMLQTSFYDKAVDPRYLEIGNKFWFVCDNLSLVRRKYKKTLLGKKVPDLANNSYAANTVWFFHGEEVAEKLLSKFSQKAHLPKNFLDIQIEPN